jgi:hypothetical protein
MKTDWGYGSEEKGARTAPYNEWKMEGYQNDTKAFDSWGFFMLKIKLGITQIWTKTFSKLFWLILFAVMRYVGTNEFWNMLSYT